MTIALDLGSHTFRSLRIQEGALRARRIRSGFCPLPDTPTHRTLLERSKATFLECEGGLVAVGDTAPEIARLLQRPVHPLLPGGHAPSGDALSRQLVNLLIESLVPPGSGTGACILILPSAMHRSNDHGAQFLASLLRLRGYAPSRIPAAQALGLAELAPHRFSGLSIVAGHSGTEISVLHLGREIASGRLARGGQWIDEQIARERGHVATLPSGAQVLLTDGAALEKEAAANYQIEGSRELIDRLSRELAWDIAQLVTHLLEEIGPAASRPLPIVCGGGTARLPGFCDLLREAMERRAPMQANGPVVIADPSPWTLCRGSLIHAELNSRPSQKAA